MKKIFTSTLLLFVFVIGSSLTSTGQQTVQFDKLTSEKALYSAKPLQLPLFEEQKNKSNMAEAINQQLSRYTSILLDKTSLQTITKLAPSLLRVALPTPDGEIHLELRKVNLFADGFSVVTSTSGIMQNLNFGVHYRGIVKGDKHSVVSLSVFPNETVGIITTSENEYNLGKSTITNEHLIYNVKDLLVSNPSICQTPDSDNPIEIKPVISYKSSASKCVKVYLETDYDVFQKKGTEQNVVQFVSGFFNEVAALYENESIKIQLSELYIWSSISPYLSHSANGYLTDFKRTRKTYNGDIAHLINMSGNLGGVAYVDVLCNRNYSYAFSSVYNDFNTVPTYSWTVNVFAHEMGHNLGSAHTHSCSWPGGAIDNCYSAEGFCSPGPKPENGGTIMSYCHLTNEGINFSNGFGILPGDKIRSEVANAACLASCETDACSAPKGLIAAGVSHNSVLLNWSGVEEAQGYQAQYRKQGNTNWVNLSISNTNQQQVSGLSERTNYEFRVQAICDVDVTSEFSGTLSVETTADQAECVSAGQNTDDEWIKTIVIGENTLESGSNGGYMLHSHQLITLQPNQTYSLTLTPGFRKELVVIEVPQPEYWKIWIDFNHDGDFLDENEMVFDAGGTSESVVTGTFILPSSITEGITNMRVSMRRGEAPPPCDSFMYGEVEDLPVSIKLGNVGVESFNDLGTLSLFPNPAKDGIVYLSIPAQMGSLKLMVYHLTGKKQAEFTIPNLSTQTDWLLPTAQLAPGIYVINAQNNFDQKSFRLLVP